MTPFTNIHVQPVATTTTPPRLPRLRKLTNDPAREYAQRPGEVEHLPDSVVALILSKQGYSKVSRNGIRVEGVAEKPLNFWCEGSITIAEKAGTNEKVLWTLNRLKPDMLHILGADGEYIESIPLEGKVPWFDEAATRKVLGAKTRANNRRVERVRQLHAPDSQAAVDAASANEIALKSIVNTFPISPRDRTSRKSPEQRIDPEETNRAGNLTGQNGDGLTGDNRAPAGGHLPSRAEGRARSSARVAFGKADRIHEIQRDLETARTQHAERVQTLARRVSEVTPQDLDDLTSDDGLEPVAALTATEIAAEEDASDCIL